jgi:L-threonylcarbamoyladenylate synthase
MLRLTKGSLYKLTARLLDVDPESPDIEKIKEAAEVIRKGGLVAFPTETVYGLGGNGLDPDAVKAIFKAKGRPADNPLILHVSDLSQVKNIAFITPLAEKLMNAFWPGPLTLVMEAKDKVPRVVTGGLGTVAVRMPLSNVARLLVRYSGVPLAGPSANRSGRPSPTDAKAVMQDLGNSIDVVLDAGTTKVGLESTVLDVTGDRACLLRPGGLELEQISRVAGNVKVDISDEKKKMSPGTRYRHYAPEVPLFLHGEGETLPCLDEYEKVGFIGVSEPPVAVNIDEKILFNDLEGYARGLFAAIREMEARKVKVIIAEFPLPAGIGLALRDRLRRASGR